MRFTRLPFALLTLVMAAAPVTAVAAPITLKFWEWEGCPDFCLDGSPDAVSATFVLDSVSYTDRIDPVSRLSIHGWGGFFLDLLFAPAIDLDGAGAPDVGYFGLSLWSHPGDGTILEDNELPIDLSFHSRLNRRRVEFADVYQLGSVGVTSDTGVDRPRALIHRADALWPGRVRPCAAPRSTPVPGWGLASRSAQAVT